MDQHDHNLLIGMRRGDEAAARTLWSRFAPRLTAYARAILARHDPAGATDIVQQVFLAALRAPRRETRTIDDPAAWLLRLTRNLALNRVRSLCRERARYRSLGATGVASSPRPCPTPDARLDLAALIDTLPRPLREVITLKHTAGLTFDQMATALAINRNTLAARYQRALTLLRDRLDAPGHRRLVHRCPALPIRRPPMHDLEHSLDSLQAPSAGDLPPTVSAALKTTRIRRRVVTGSVMVALIALLAAIPTLVTPRPSSSRTQPFELATTSDLPAISLASLTLRNRDLDPDRLFLPSLCNPAIPSALGPTDADIGLR